MKRRKSNKFKRVARQAEWHSSLGGDVSLKKMEVRVAATQENLREFHRYGRVLINKTSRKLWMYDDKSKTLVRLFDDADMPLKLDEPSTQE